MTTGPPVALTIAGSDSGAGAGIQADIKAMAALGVFATTVVTAVTAQNTSTVAGVHLVPAAFVDLQITTVLSDLPIAAVKTGMLGTTSVIDVVGRRARAGDLHNLVVDPVMVASTGRPLVSDDAINAYRRYLVPYALIVTPNLWEAALLAGMDIGELTSTDAMADAARTIHELGARWVLVKGGHLPGVTRSSGARTGSPGDRSPSASMRSTVPDVLFDGADATVLTASRVDTANTHGTGCSLSAAITARLASGIGVGEAVGDAKRAVHAALVGGAGWRLGNGHGPLDHIGWSADHDAAATAPGGSPETGTSPETTATGS